jgi:hypothetical protein
MSNAEEMSKRKGEEKRPILRINEFLAFSIGKEQK